MPQLNALNVRMVYIKSFWEYFHLLSGSLILSSSPLPLPCRCFSFSYLPLNVDAGIFVVAQAFPFVTPFYLFADPTILFGI